MKELNLGKQVTSQEQRLFICFMGAIWWGHGGRVPPHFFRRGDI